MKQIKFCGIRRDEDVKFVNELQPDYIGLIFYENSHRNVSVERAKQITNMLSEQIKAVGVFVDKPIDKAVEICKEANLDLIQLHGNENEEYINKLKDLTALPIIKAVRYKNDKLLYEADKLPVDYLLIDTYKKGSIGGTGQSFNWKNTPYLNKPFFLAGGINSENFLEALNTKAYCIDVSSGIETDNIKDYDKMKTLIKMLHK